MRKYLNNPDLGMLLLRLGVGLTMAITHGFGKIPPNDQLVSGVSNLGFPIPIFFAWAAALSEFLGGLLIALGLFTRYGAFFLGLTMSVAFFIVHAADDFGVKELAFVYMISSLFFIFNGAGKYSLDRIIWKK